MYSNGLKDLINSLNDQKITTDVKQVVNEHMDALVDGVEHNPNASALDIFDIKNED